MATRQASLRVMLAVAGSLLLPTATGIAAPPADCDRCFAMVRAYATIVKHRGLSANYNMGVGVTDLLFLYDLSGCAITATIDSLVVNSTKRRAIVSVNRRSSFLVRVTVTRTDGTAVDQPFSLAVTC